VTNDTGDSNWSDLAGAPHSIGFIQRDGLGKVPGQGKGPGGGD
jgi:hypothetical protein